ncbi:hypothetical protein BZARG_2323 [Bizionia argentinensis JUB59]|uniref:Nuclear transport factor 2 family protein n=1 Tax=Bizionia argentinensis JUB59 TaxID=1046627 RepID=G2EGR5_9FLAO|nr:hypothetical protein [Bizionia argentinensis]EGV42407.1 hypothetical protein BZARG_2323 [Bizionia argentinensis JUB59]
MKKTLIFLVFFILFSQLQAQLLLDPSSRKVGTIDAIITELYAVNSGKKGYDRNWTDYKYLFYPGAKIIPTGRSLDGNHLAKYMSADEYKDVSGEWLKSKGYIEKEIHRKMDVFGNIAHVFSTFQVYHSEDDPYPAMRGIKSIQLLNDGMRWWIINVYWMQETPVKPIPRDYLPD